MFRRPTGGEPPRASGPARVRGRRLRAVGFAVVGRGNADVAFERDGKIILIGKADGACDFFYAFVRFGEEFFRFFDTHPVHVGKQAFARNALELASDVRRRIEHGGTNVFGGERNVEVFGDIAHDFAYRFFGFRCVFGALFFGLLIGMLFCVPLRWFKKDGNRLSLIIGFVFFGVGIASMFGFSSLLMCMAIGAGFANFSSQVPHIMKLTDGLTPPIFMLFFVLSGAELDLSVVPTVGLFGVIYIVMRVVGKMCGASFGAALCKAEKNVRKYLGPALMPQAGVAIGLSLVATRVVPDHGAQIRAIILCGTLIYELFGPVVTKISLTKAGEIVPAANEKK